ncbi:hypothetical protein TNCV_872971 [Trichonephila clavipes]|nr:hypothetical protein TNCV_872971 [Trichonephila clavipes]
MAHDESLHPYPKNICGTTVGCILLACRKQLIGRANCWSNFWVVRISEFMKRAERLFIGAWPGDEIDSHRLLKSLKEKIKTKGEGRSRMVGIR